MNWNQEKYLSNFVSIVWEIVKAILKNPDVSVNWIFVTNQHIWDIDVLKER